MTGLPFGQPKAMYKSYLLTLAIFLCLATPQNSRADDKNRNILYSEIRQSIRLLESGTAGHEDATKIADAIDGFETQYPEEDLILSVLVGSYLDALDVSESGLLRQTLEHYASHKNIRIRTLAEGKLRLLGYFTKPMNLRFISSISRPVDVANLQGKVILLIFWSTWCPNCREEIESIKEIYSKYFGHEFEIIGISLEMAPSDRSQNSQQKTLQQFNDYLSANNIKWPNYYDGRLWDNEIAVSLCIRSIPKTILLKRDGLVDSVRLRGDKLEKRIVELLKGNRTP